VDKKKSPIYVATGRVAVAMRVGDLAREVAAREELRDAMVARVRDRAEERVAQIRREAAERIAKRTAEAGR
jgi:hypothetical protein